MTAIDLNAKAESLGIAFEDYRAGSRMVSKALWDYQGKETLEEYIAAVKSVPREQRVAFIRWNNLHKTYPDHFTWNEEE